MGVVKVKVDVKTLLQTLHAFPHNFFYTLYIFILSADFYLIVFGKLSQPYIKKKNNASVFQKTNFLSSDMVGLLF